MASPAAALLPSAPVGHHHPPPIFSSTTTTTTSSSPPATNSPPPAATSTTTSSSSSPTPPAAGHPPAALLLHPFRPDLLLLPNGGTSVKKTGGGGVAAAIGAGKPAYATPSPVENTPQNNECKLVEVKGAQLASFTVRDAELICLPQAFDLFLKHLVGGLHTVYTKLKRLDITPVVCNVEQVRVLRGLGAIQPGVNRCKLISVKDFEVLYNDCTNASSRPGRPPKRLQSLTSSECGSHMVSHSGLMSAGIMPPAGAVPGRVSEVPCGVPLGCVGGDGWLGCFLSPPLIHRRGLNDRCSRSSLSALAKKIKLEVMSGYHGSLRHGGPNGENGDHNPGLGLDQLPFMMISHPLIPASLGPASVSMAMGQMNRLSTLERVRDSPSPSASLDDAQGSSNQDSSVSSSPVHMDRTGEATHMHFDGLSANLSVLGHSPGRVPGSRDTDMAALELCTKDGKRNHTERDTGAMTNATAAREASDRQIFQGQRLVLGGCERAVYPGGQKFQAGLNAPFIFPEGLSSIETLLTNIQGLLRVAIENARAQEKQDQLERTELKLELVRERELRETLERQLSVEQKNRGTRVALGP
ncbi:hypothetical protein NHX12_022032 [Muraenolepis orangiensis]|uniref:SKI/SNO/DAC domain-containing protein n=1 Tax=Muraenolepis orangiensis TaxID=630683 RepID=A0A9Q0EP60_9TELE|nr:hypothetical protein NHX12_022032 [Muraenolepis orangiensis]